MRDPGRGLACLSFLGCSATPQTRPRPKTSLLRIITALPGSQQPPPTATHTHTYTPSLLPLPLPLPSPAAVPQRRIRPAHPKLLISPPFGVGGWYLIPDT